MKRVIALLGAAACILLPAGGEAGAGRRLTAMGDDGGGGVSVNLIVRQVKVTPVRAHVGDKIRIDAVIENVGEGRGTTEVKVYADKRQVAGRFLYWGESDYRTYRESFVWDTKGIAPGEYRIRAEIFVWEDTSPFDNELAVTEPVALLPAGAPFAAGQPGGGEAIAVDPRWRPDRPSDGSGSRNRPASSGIVRETESGRMR